MAGSSDFLPFGTAAGAFVLTNSEYQALASRPTGFGPGLLPKERLNKAIRQGSAMAAAIGGFIAAAGYSANDDGNIPALTTAFINALGGAAGALKLTDFQGAHQQLALDGWQDIPGGLIVQWRHGMVDGSGITNITWPKAFPNLCFGAVISPETNNMPDTPPVIRSKSQTGAAIDCRSGGDNPYCFIIALGF